MKRFLSKSLLGLALLASSYAVACSHQNVETQEEEKVVESKKTQQASTGTTEETDEHEDVGGDEGGEEEEEEEQEEEITNETLDVSIRLNATNLNLGVGRGLFQYDQFLLSAMIDSENSETPLVDEGHLVFESTNPEKVRIFENVVDPDLSQCGWATTTQALVQAIGGQIGDEVDIKVWYELDSGAKSPASICKVTICEYTQKNSALKNEEGDFISVIDMGPEFMSFQNEDIPLFKHVSADVPTYIPFVMYSNFQGAGNNYFDTTYAEGGATGMDFDPAVNEELHYTISYSIQNITYEGEDPVGLEMDWDNFILNAAPTRLFYNSGTNIVSIDEGMQDPSNILYNNNVFYFPIAGIEGRFSGTVMMNKTYLGSRLGEVATVPTPLTLTFDVEVDA